MIEDHDPILPKIYDGAEFPVLLIDSESLARVVQNKTVHLTPQIDHVLINDRSSSDNAL